MTKALQTRTKIDKQANRWQHNNEVPFFAMSAQQQANPQIMGSPVVQLRKSETFFSKPSPFVQTKPKKAKGSFSTLTADSISKPVSGVGEGGVNVVSDVILILGKLKEVGAVKGWGMLLEYFSLLGIKNSEPGQELEEAKIPVTIAGIYQFQQSLGWSGDGNISPGGTTIKRLNKAIADKKAGELWDKTKESAEPDNIKRLYDSAGGKMANLAELMTAYLLPNPPIVEAMLNYVPAFSKGLLAYYITKQVNDQMLAGTSDNLLSQLYNTMSESWLFFGKDLMMERIADILFLGATSKWSRPLDDTSLLQSPGGSGWRGAVYGCYRNSCTRPHRGLDFYATVGSNIYAVQDGKLTRGNAGGYGKFVWLTAGNVRYRYAHLSSYKPNGNYKAGDVIGKTGISGNANAGRPHLHIEAQENKSYVDPSLYFGIPSRVRGAYGAHTIKNIDFSEPEKCMPCSM